MLFMLGLLVFGDHKLWPMWLGAVGLVTLTSAPAFFDTAPRLVLTTEGLSWREHKRDPLSFLPWDQIVSAEIENGAGDDAPRCLRFRAPSPPILESIASERERRRAIEIPVERLTLSERQLMAAIHRRAPHLFTRISRRET